LSLTSQRLTVSTGYKQEIFSKLICVKAETRARGETSYTAELGSVIRSQAV